MDADIEEIAEYVSDRFQNYVSEMYEATKDKIENSSEKLQALKSSCEMRLIIAGYKFVNNKVGYPVVFDKRIDAVLTDFPNLIYNYQTNILTYGIQSISTEIQEKLNNTIFHSETELLNTLKACIKCGAEETDAIGSRATIYKMSLKNGKELIERVD